MAEIVLEYPFKNDWRKGYLVTNKEPRRNVILYNSNSNRSTISYARYLMSVRLGRYLSKDEYVDHIDGDSMNDTFENYQILSAKDNIVKSVIQRDSGEVYVQFSCGVCGKEFDRKRRNTHLANWNKHRRSTYCSRVCSGRSSKFPESIFLKEFRKYREVNRKVKI